MPRTEQLSGCDERVPDAGRDLRFPANADRSAAPEASDGMAAGAWPLEPVLPAVATTVVCDGGFGRTVLSPIWHGSSGLPIRLLECGRFTRWVIREFCSRGYEEGSHDARP
jgi:hypothetical protein